MYLIYMYLKTCEGIVSRNKELLMDAFIIIISFLHVYQMCILIFHYYIIFIGFVLVIKEKDLVILKVIKQQYRRMVKREKELNNKLEQYRVSNNTQIFVFV